MVEAVPAEDWAFYEWFGGSQYGERSQEPIARIPIEMTINVSPWFVERPGLASLDLLSDFKDFLVEIGEITEQDSIYDLTVDWGDYHIDGVDVFEGNGISDVAEIALFYHILKSVHLNETNNGVYVIPAHAGIQWVSTVSVFALSSPRFHGDDGMP